MAITSIYTYLYQKTSKNNLHISYDILLSHTWSMALQVSRSIHMTTGWDVIAPIRYTEWFPQKFRIRCWKCYFNVLGENKSTPTQDLHVTPWMKFIFIYHPILPRKRIFQVFLAFDFDGRNLAKHRRSDVGCRKSKKSGIWGKLNVVWRCYDLPW